MNIIISIKWGDGLYLFEMFCLILSLFSAFECTSSPYTPSQSFCQIKSVERNQFNSQKQRNQTGRTFLKSYLNILPACRAEWPTSPLGLLVQARPRPPSVLSLPWHSPYSQDTRALHPVGEFSHTSVPCFPIPLYYREKRNGRLKGWWVAHSNGISVFKYNRENSGTHVRTSDKRFPVWKKTKQCWSLLVHFYLSAVYF